MAVFRPYQGDALQYYLRGFCRAYLAPHYSRPGEPVPPDMTGPYNEGLGDGEMYATQGFPVDPVCYDLRMPGDHNPIGTAAEVIDLGFEAYGVGHAIVTGAVAGALFEGAILMLMASIALTTHYRYPEEALPPQDYEAFSELIGTIAEPVSLELFTGGGVDLMSNGCSLRMTRVYKSADEVRSEVERMGRGGSYFVCSVRTDQSGSFRVVESNVVM